MARQHGGGFREAKCPGHTARRLIAAKSSIEENLRGPLVVVTGTATVMVDNLVAATLTIAIYGRTDVDMVAKYLDQIVVWR